MNHLVYELFKKAKSEDEEVSSNAVTDLSFILEMNSWRLSKDQRMSRYGVLVSQDVIEIEIDEHDEAEIVEFLHDQIEKGHKFTSGMLFAIGQATCKVGLRPLIYLLEQHLDRFNENEFYQALVSLERLLFFKDTLSLEEEREILAKTNLLLLISKKILSFQPISRCDLESTSLRLLASLILLLNSDNRS